MKPMFNFLGRYDAAIWIRVLGTVLTAVTGFMLRPFLVLYLYDKLGNSVLLPMLVVGLQPLVGMVMSVWGGQLTDRYGRKPLMLISLLIQTVSMAGFMFAQSVWQFAIFAVLNGVGMSLFFPAANAQVADVVPLRQRAEVFALLHTALNLGSAIGPMLGLLVFKQSPALVFGIASAATLTYALLVWRKIPETMPPIAEGAVSQSAKPPKFVLRDHQTILWLTLFALPVGLLYAQAESILPLHLRSQFPNFETIFATLMTINGTTVVLLQMWLAKRTEHVAAQKVILIAYLLLALVGFGYAYAPSFAILIGVELVFTIGEMLNGPHLQKVVSQIAPTEMRGRYSSIYGLSWQLPRALGPLLGGALFEAFGGRVTFTFFGCLLLVAGACQHHLLKRIAARVDKAFNHSRKEYNQNGSISNKGG